MSELKAFHKSLTDRCELGKKNSSGCKRCAIWPFGPRMLRHQHQSGTRGGLSVEWPVLFCLTSADVMVALATGSSGESKVQSSSSYMF